jgi:hypothetical protein
VDGRWHGSRGWGRTGASWGGRGRGHRAGGESTGGRRLTERQPADGRGPVTPNWLADAFWWFGGRKEVERGEVVALLVAKRPGVENARSFCCSPYN